MAILGALTNVKVWWDKYDLSGDHRSLSLEYGAEALDATVFGNTTRVRTGGLKTISLTGEGFWQGGEDEIDDVLFSRIGAGSTAVTISPDGGDEGDVAYFFQPIGGAYTPLSGELGSVLPFTINAEGRSTLVRGTVMQNGTETSTGSGTSRQLGEVAAGQRLFAALHVLSVSGTSPTLDVLVRSDDDTGMGSATTRITFAEATDSVNLVQWATPVSGTIADDDWWDISWTIGGTDTPTFSFVVVVGIL